MKRFKAMVALSSVSLLAAACGSSAAPSTTVAATPKLSVTNSSKYGSIVVAPNGMVLYAFTADSPTKSNCTGSCAAVWGPFIASKVTVGSGLNSSLVTYIKRGSGREQVAYNGHPLYYFADDTTAGVASGEGIKSFGGSWYVVSSSGSPVTSVAASTATTASSSYGGY
jgi:predicted lipoprotein with Yx(FWY)xxD motif